jgi:hypothetical protein
MLARACIAREQYLAGVFVDYNGGIFRRPRLSNPGEGKHDRAQDGKSQGKLDAMISEASHHLDTTTQLEAIPEKVDPVFRLELRFKNTLGAFNETGFIEPHEGGCPTKLSNHRGIVGESVSLSNLYPQP